MRTAVVNRPLVVRCGAFGDMVLITALVRDLHARFGHEVDLVTSGPWSIPLLEGQPGVGNVWNVRSRKTPYWLSLDQRRVVRQLRARGPGPTWFCDGGRAALPMLTRAGISDEFMVDVRDHPLLPGEHATEQWHRLAQLTPAVMGPVAAATVPLAATGSATGGQLEVSRGQRADLKAFLRARGIGNAPLLAIQMGNKRTMRRGFKRLAVNSKYWPQERWAAVIRHIRARHPGHALVLLGTGPEQQLNREVAALAGAERLHNVADDLPIPRLVALLSRAAGLVTVDSGPAHAAAAVGCPLVVLFGKALPSLYAPRGMARADVKVLTGVMDGQPDMLGIDTARVISAWDSLTLRSA